MSENNVNIQLPTENTSELNQPQSRIELDMSLIIRDEPKANETRSKTSNELLLRSYRFKKSK